MQASLTHSPLSRCPTHGAPLQLFVVQQPRCFADAVRAYAILGQDYSAGGVVVRCVVCRSPEET